MPLRAKVDDRTMVFDEMVVGEEFPELKVVFDEELQGRFLVALKEENPWYYSDSPWGGPITYHPLIDDERVREASKCGLIHVPVSISEKIKTGKTREEE